MAEGTISPDQIRNDSALNLSGYDVLALSFSIGANTLTTSEWANLDGLNQTLATTSSPTFNGITLTSITIGANTLNTTEWAFLDGQDQAVKTTSNVTHNNLTLNGGTITLGVDTNFVLTGGVNGVSFDTNVLSIDATNNRVGVGTATPATVFDLLSHNFYIGADGTSATTRTANTNKLGVVGIPHYATSNGGAEEEAIAALLTSNTNSANTVVIGGGSASYNAATSVQIWTGATYTTTGGTARLNVMADGKIGISCTAPDKQLEINHATGACLRLTYNDSNGSATTKTDFDIDSAGELTITSPTTKTVVFSPVVYDDIRITPGNFDRAGSADPTIVSYTPTGSSIATYLYQFAKNDIAYFTVQIPHAYKVGADIKVHLHWTPGLRGNEESGATVGWKVDYAWANINGTFGAMATADLSDACDGTDDKHQMTPDVTITGTNKGISSMLICNIKRTDTGTDDTWAGTASGQLPMLLEVDFHFPIDTIGSRDWGTK